MFTTLRPGMEGFLFKSKEEKEAARKTRAIAHANTVINTAKQRVTKTLDESSAWFTTIAQDIQVISKNMKTRTFDNTLFDRLTISPDYGRVKYSDIVGGTHELSTVVSFVKHLVNNKFNYKVDQYNGVYDDFIEHVISAIDKFKYYDTNNDNICLQATSIIRWHDRNDTTITYKSLGYSEQMFPFVVSEWNTVSNYVKTLTAMKTQVYQLLDLYLQIVTEDSERSPMLDDVITDIIHLYRCAINTCYTHADSYLCQLMTAASHMSNSCYK